MNSSDVPPVDVLNSDRSAAAVPVPDEPVTHVQMSVVMAVKNGMPYLPEQWASIVEQLGSGDELVVSDQHSTDGSWEWMQRQAQVDSRIRVFALPKITGVSGGNPIARNFDYALSQARGQFIVLADHDDVWLPGRLARLREVFAASPDLLAVQTDVQLVDKNLNSLNATFFALRGSRPGVWRNYRKNSWQGCGMAFSARLLPVILPIPKSVPMHDMWIGLLAELSGDVRFLAESWTLYRRHDQNQSALKRSGWIQVVCWRWQLAVALVRRWPKVRQLRQAML